MCVVPVISFIDFLLEFPALTRETVQGAVVTYEKTERTRKTNRKKIIWSFFSSFLSWMSRYSRACVFCSWFIVLVL